MVDLIYFTVEAIKECLAFKKPKEIMIMFYRLKELGLTSPSV